MKRKSGISYETLHTNAQEILEKFWPRLLTSTHVRDHIYQIIAHLLPFPVRTANVQVPTKVVAFLSLVCFF